LNLDLASGDPGCPCCSEFFRSGRFAPRQLELSSESLAEEGLGKGIDGGEFGLGDAQ
jgi:hypothetical protein